MADTHKDFSEEMINCILLMECNLRVTFFKAPSLYELSYYLSCFCIINCLCNMSLIQSYAFCTNT